MLRLASMAVLALAILFSVAPTSTAVAQDPEEVRKARLFQVYLKVEHSLRELLDAEASFNVARRDGRRADMSDEAAEMFAHSTRMAYWSVVLDDRVKADDKTTAEARELTSRLRETSVRVYRNLANVVSTNDMDALGTALDESQTTLNELGQVIFTIYQRLQERFALQ